MSELRTLKDLFIYYDLEDNKTVNEEEIKELMRLDTTCNMIREEAIKWVQELRKDLIKIGTKPNSCMIGTYAVNYWMAFFNITEEELK